MRVQLRLSFGQFLWAGALLILGASTAAAEAAKQEIWKYVRVVAVANDQSSLDIEVTPFHDCTPTKPIPPPSDDQQLHLIVQDAIVKDRVKQLHLGDRITITFSYGANNQNPLKTFSIDAAPFVPAITRFWVVCASGVVLFLIYYLWSGLHPLKLILGEDGRYSNSKFQIALWFFVLITTYLTTVVFRIWYAGCDFIGGVEIPKNLLLISGMSVLTFAGAKAITTAKVNAEMQKANGNQDPKNSANVTPNLFQDLTHNDGTKDQDPQIDFGDFQMLIITVIAVAVYLTLVFSFLGTIVTSKSVTLPDVDTTILAAFGLGHGAYLTKKAVGNVGQS